MSSTEISIKLFCFWSRVPVTPVSKLYDAWVSKRFLTDSGDVSGDNSKSRFVLATRVRRKSPSSCSVPGRMFLLRLYQTSMTRGSEKVLDRIWGCLWRQQQVQVRSGNVSSTKISSKLFYFRSHVPVTPASKLCDAFQKGFQKGS